MNDCLDPDHWVNGGEYDFCDPMAKAFTELEEENKRLRAILKQCRTALAAMLCAGDPHCPTEREARLLCVAAMQELNKRLNTGTTGAKQEAHTNH